MLVNSLFFIYLMVVFGVCVDYCWMWWLLLSLVVFFVMGCWLVFGMFTVWGLFC